MNVTWFKCKSGSWCKFDSLNLNTVDEKGVYVIGYKSASDSIYTIYVGQGDIAERLSDHRTDERITTYRGKGTLYTTGANVPTSYRDGVKRYLADRLSPLVGSRHPDVAPISVNLPSGWV